VNVYESETAKMDGQDDVGGNLCISKVYQSMENLYTYVKEAKPEENMQAVSR